jgi:hypothetical protein
MVGLAELDAYYARKTADEYGTITVDDDYWVTTNQIYYDNYQASNVKRQEINDTKTAADKTNNRQARRDNNNNYTEYFEAWLALQTTYEIAIAMADETYYNTVTTAEITASKSIESAERTYNQTVSQLDEQFDNALKIIDNGNNIETGHFSATSSGNSMNTATKPSGNNNESNQNSSGGLIGIIKSFFGKIQYYVNHYNDVTLGSVHDLPNKDLGNVPINPDNFAVKMRLQQQIHATDQIADYTNNLADGLQEVQVQLATLPIGSIIFSTTEKFAVNVGGKFIVRNADDLTKAMVKALDVGDKIAMVITAMREVMKVNGFEKNGTLSKINGREIYFDKENKIYYSFDTQHGEFEIHSLDGKHIGVANIDFKIIKSAIPGRKIKVR